MRSLINKLKSLFTKLKRKYNKKKVEINLLFNQYFFYCQNKKFRHKQKILLLATPTYLNVGDLAIVYATKKWLSDKFNYPIIELHEAELETYIPVLKKLVNTNDIIILPGGGNLSDRYAHPELCRHFVVNNFSQNKIIILPQSVFFYDKSDQRSRLKESQLIYSSHKNLTICTRDKYSFELAKKYFPENNIECFPDMFFYCNNEFNDYTIERKDVLLCLRNDIEGRLSEQNYNKLLNDLKERNLNYSYQDTHLTNTKNIFFKWRNDIDKKERDKVVENMALLFKKYKVVVTDRFHGFIFSYITNTPCVLLNSEDHKIKEGLRWIKNSNFIFYVGDDYSKIMDNIEKSLDVIPQKTNDFYTDYFLGLEKLLTKDLKI